MDRPALSSLPPFERGYVLGLLSLEHKSLREMYAQGVLPCSVSYAAQLLSADPNAHRRNWPERLASAPQGGYLAVDLLVNQRQGQAIEGVGRVYSSCEKGLVWGHSFVSVGLVYPEQDPYPLRLDPFVTEALATAEYPHLTPTEALLNAASEIALAGYPLKSVVVDAQFTSKLALRSLDAWQRELGLAVPLVGRFRTNTKVVYQGECLSFRELAERFPPGKKARYYKRFGWYVKRVKVVLPEVGEVDLLIVWKAKGLGFELMALISTLAGGVQEILTAWQSRWRQEVGHKLAKQGLGQGDCQCRKYAAQLKHNELVIEAFHLTRAERVSEPNLSWREAQRRAARRLADIVWLPGLGESNLRKQALPRRESAMVTGNTALAA